MLRAQQGPEARHQRPQVGRTGVLQVTGLPSSRIQSSRQQPVGGVEWAMAKIGDVASRPQSWAYLAALWDPSRDERVGQALGVIVADTLVATTAPVAEWPKVAVTIANEAGAERSVSEHSGFVVRRDKRVSIVEISPATGVDLPRLPPTGARPTAGQQCVIPVLADDAINSQVFFGQVTSVSEDGSLEVALGNVLPGFSPTAGAPVTVDGVVVGMVAASSGGPATVLAYPIEEVQRLLPAPTSGRGPRTVPDAEKKSQAAPEPGSGLPPQSESEGRADREPAAGTEPGFEGDEQAESAMDSEMELDRGLEPERAVNFETKPEREPQPKPPAPPPELRRNAREALGYIHTLMEVTTTPTPLPPLAHAQAPIVLGALWHASRPEVHSTSQALLDVVSKVANDDGEPVARRLQRAAVAATGSGSAIELLEKAPPIPRDALTTPPLAAVLAEAHALAIETGHDLVGLRHLVSVALSAPPTDALSHALDELKVSGEQLRAALRSSVAEMRPDDSAEAWDRILATRAREIELEGGFSADVVDPTQGIPLERDHLDVREYVTMLATLIADKDTPLPLSIGLFGEWGSGKSYFMGLLRGEVDALAGSDSNVYYTSIRQIGFNAWHYADTNLWASLGDEIFAQLAEADQPTTKEQSRRLQEELDTTLQSRVLLKQAADRAKEETARLSAELDQASAKVRQSRRELFRAAKDSETVRNQLDTAWQLLGLDAKPSLERERLLAEHLEAEPERYDALRLFVRDRRGLLLGGAALAVLLLVLALVVVLPSNVGRWLVGGGLLTLGGLVGAAVRLIDRFRAGLQTLDQAAAEINESLEEQKAAKVAAETKALRQAEAEERVLQAQLDEVTARAGELGRELAKLSPGQRLYSFVTERAGSDEYRRHLGLVSTVRKDFEQLTRLMKDWTKRARSNQENAPLPIDRIVLYIDDLDRCSPRQVVDVLQAVHLLLALELFVVVVGVDPRWLLRSLRSRYRELLTSVDEAGVVEWQASPQDYLEKIFHIPFALPRMTPESFATLLGNLVAGKNGESHRADGDGEDSRDTGGEASDQQASIAPPAPGGVLSGEEADGPTRDGGDTPLPTAADEADLHVDRESTVGRALEGEPEREVRPLTPPELRMLTSLAPLVQTPREAKRLVNLYRMIRSIRNLSPAERFLGSERRPGEYQAVVILLGLLSGHGRLLEHVLAAPPKEGARGGLRHWPSGATWQAFVDGIRPQPNGNDWRNQIVGAVPDAALEEWQRLSDGLQGPTALVSLADLSCFQEWAPRVARFSFLLVKYADDTEAVLGAAPA